MNIKEQIESIIAKSEQKQTVEGMVNYAHGVMVFFLELVDGGITRKEALVLTVAMMQNINGGGEAK